MNEILTPDVEAIGEPKFEDDDFKPNEDFKPGPLVYNPPPVVATPATLLQMAVEQGADIDKLEKLMALQERWEANQAEKAFNLAMSEFSANLPTIEKTVYVKHFDGYHADLSVMAAAVRQAMSPHGLSFKWDTNQGDKISVSCIIKHKDGHKEAVTLSSAPDTSGGKNAIQAIGSAVKYLERYTLEAATGIAASAKDDDDGKGSEPVENITEEQCLKIESLISDHDLDSERFHAWLKQDKGVEHIDELPAIEFRSVIRKVNSTIEAKNANS